MPIFFRKASAHRLGRKGIAMLLVMIALVVGTTLATGFLLTQGTSIGIARNERDFDSCRSLAETGIDMCIWQIKNNSNWRTALSPGTWINNLSIGSGSVTVTAADGAGNNSFSADYTQSVNLTSVGTLNGRTYTVTSTIAPSAGGYPFANGAFVQQSTTLQGSALVDSFNTLQGPYATSSAHNAILGTASNGSGSLSLALGSKFYGSYVGGPTGLLSSLLNLLSLFLTPPSSVSNAAFARNPGSIVLPNTVGFTNGVTFSKSISYTLATNNVAYSSFSISGTGTVVNLPLANQTIHVTGSVNINSNTTLQVPTGVNAVMVVDGNFSSYGNINIVGTGTLTIYVAGSIDLQVGSVNNPNAAPSSFLLLGTSNGNITIHGNVSGNGAIYAPNCAVGLNGGCQWYGSIIGQQLNLGNSAQLHLDDALKTTPFHNLTGGTTMGDYSIVWRE